MNPPVVKLKAAYYSQNQQLKDDGCVAFKGYLSWLLYCPFALLLCPAVFCMCIWILSSTFVCLPPLSLSVFFCLASRQKTLGHVLALQKSKAVNAGMRALPLCFLNTRAPEHKRPVLDQRSIIGCYSIVTDVGELTRRLWGFWGTARGDNHTVWEGHINATHSIIVGHLHINWGHHHNAQHAFMCNYRLRADLKGAIRGRSYVAAIHPSKVHNWNRNYILLDNWENWKKTMLNSEALSSKWGRRNHSWTFWTFPTTTICLAFPFSNFSCPIFTPSFPWKSFNNNWITFLYSLNTEWFFYLLIFWAILFLAWDWAVYWADR